MKVSIKELADFLFRRRCLKKIIEAGANCLENEISEISIDSRHVGEGALFCCLEGTKRKGVEFAQDAQRRGAVAVLTSERVDDLAIPQLIVKDAGEACGLASAYFYGLPASKLLMIAVTGTNGKSTTTYLIKSILDTGDMKCGLIGTIVYNDGKSHEDADRTTPQAPLIQSLLNKMVDNRCHACVMEASSHGIEQKRIFGCLYDRAVFTNLTPEHLDYHGDMENYFCAKRDLFIKYMRGDWKASINTEDPYGEKIANEFAPHILGFSLRQKADNAFYGSIRSSSIRGIIVDISFPDGSTLENVTLPLLGEYNVLNALAASSVAWSLDFDAEAIRKGLENCPPVPGRLERYFVEDGPVCIIDYAHTPDALEKVLSTVKPLCSGRVWLVFGHGGERFKENRPILGSIAARFADCIVVTMDNPRSEDPRDIAMQIADGIKSSPGSSEYWTIIDRKEAVHFALDRAGKGDVVLVTGKGPERQIIFKDRTIPYNDFEALKEWCNLKGRTLS